MRPDERSAATHSVAGQCLCSSSPRCSTYRRRSARPRMWKRQHYDSGLHAPDPTPSGSPFPCPSLRLRQRPALSIFRTSQRTLLPSTRRPARMRKHVQRFQSYRRCSPMRGPRSSSRWSSVSTWTTSAATEQRTRPSRELPADCGPASCQDGLLTLP